jgi:hypothetical protein
MANAMSLAWLKAIRYVNWLFVLYLHRNALSVQRRKVGVFKQLDQ